MWRPAARFQSCSERGPDSAILTKGRIDIVFAVCLLIIGSYVVGDKLIIEPLSRHYRAGK